MSDPTSNTTRIRLMKTAALVLIVLTSAFQFWSMHQQTLLVRHLVLQACGDEMGLGCRRS